jgi:GrpB-like predicted nucleotidyltransferase (UPF0157 family)
MHRHVLAIVFIDPSPSVPRRAPGRAIMPGVELIVVDPDPRWPDAAAELIAELRGTLPGAFAEVEHIGSTAVPGLAAKPVIDVMAAAGDLEGTRARADERLPSLGYRRVDIGMPRRIFYRRQPGPYAAAPALGVHLHVVELHTWETRNQRILRDHLRAHPEDAARYAALKRELATRVADRDAYTRAKTALIQELVDRARASRGLPPVDVWEG